jgi:hypothetical protein
MKGSSPQRGGRPCVIVDHEEREFAAKKCGTRWRKRCKIRDPTLADNGPDGVSLLVLLCGVGFVFFLLFRAEEREEDDVADGS